MDDLQTRKLCFARLNATVNKERGLDKIDNYLDGLKVILPLGTD